MRIVLDTNVLVSSFITKGTAPDLLYQAWDAGTFQLVTSIEQLDELERALIRDQPVASVFCIDRPDRTRRDSEQGSRCYRAVQAAAP